MTDTMLVSKATELPASREAHMHRTAVLLAVLQRLDTTDLPPVDTWSSSSRDYLTKPYAPALVGRISSAFYTGLDKARADVQAWATALGTTMTERYVEDSGRSIQLQAAVEADGVLIRVGLDLPAYDKCPGCGGPAVGSTVLRHFTDAPCSGARALPA